MTAQPWNLRVFQDGPWLTAVLTVKGAPRPFRYRLNLAKLRAAFLRVMRKHMVVGASLKKLWRKVKRGARKAVSSKVWRAVEGAANKYGSALPPPWGPAVQAAGNTMKASRALIQAEKALKKGDKRKALALVRGAEAITEKHGGSLIEAAAARRGVPMYLALVS